MAAVDKNIRVNTSSEVYSDNRNAMFPVKKNTITLCPRYLVGTDFTSGDSLVLMLYGCKKILFAVAKTPSNTFLTLTEADVTTVGAMGKTLTTGTSTTDIEIFVIYEV